MEFLLKNLLLLNIILGPDNKKIKNIINEYENEYYFAEKFLESYSKSLYLNIKQKENISNLLKQNFIEKYMIALQEKSIDVITLYDSDYPQRLKNIIDAPVMLYINDRKKLNKIEFFFTVIGSRKATNYGMWVTKKIAGELSRKKICIVSGFADGIDTVAHKAALENNGMTVAVLACGIDVIYPAKNKDLYHKIMEKGIIISEFSLNCKAVAYNFPLRNRLLSGLSDGVLVVEATEGSGTMLTCNYAAEQGREVYAVPGNIDSLYSKGTNRLISEGAKIVMSSVDILEDFQINVGNNKFEHIEFTDDEKKIIELLNEGAKDIAEVCEHFNCNVNSIYNVLTIMELNGYIVQENGKKFRLNY